MCQLTLPLDFRLLLLLKIAACPVADVLGLKTIPVALLSHWDLTMK